MTSGGPIRGAALESACRRRLFLLPLPSALCRLLQGELEHVDEATAGVEDQLEAAIITGGCAAGSVAACLPACRPACLPGQLDGCLLAAMCCHVLLPLLLLPRLQQAACFPALQAM